MSNRDADMAEFEEFVRALPEGLWHQVQETRPGHWQALITNKKRQKRRWTMCSAIRV